VSQAPALTEAADRQFAAIRKALIERRRAIPMSMSELGRRVGVSASMISQIERGQTLPSVGTLFALAAALGVTVDAFLEPGPEIAASPPEQAGPKTSTDAAEDLYVVRRANRASVPIKGGVRWERLAPGSLGDIEFLELDYAAHAESDANLYRHPGMEMVLVLEGVFEIHLGFDRFRLEAGDSIAFPSSLPHRYVNPTDAPARAVTTIVRDRDMPAGEGR
jgi:transcriptional regulator with XRE-family HTH domain